LLHAVEWPASIKDPFMAFEVSPDGSNASITVSSKASDKRGSARRVGANAQIVENDHVASR
jgi:hypothetical protein